MSQSTRTYDLIVVGAGPAGMAVVLSLLPYNLRIAVIDKATFPRDKVCGDAIPGRAVRVIRSFWEEIDSAFNAFTAKLLMQGGSTYSPKGHLLGVDFSTEGYTCPRVDFDAFLVDQAVKYSDADFYFGTLVQGAANRDGRVEVELKKGTHNIQAPIIIGCDGYQSIVARALGQLPKQDACASVRGYFKNLALSEPRLFIHLLKDYLPGYFWIFPLANGHFNVGFGMMTKELKARKLNMRKVFLEIINQEPSLTTIFQNAESINEAKGFGLPLFAGRTRISGDNYLLAGDAAALIDPATGEGIGNAMLSGQLAAHWALQAINQQTYSASFFQQYDQAVYRKIGGELQQKRWIQKILSNRPGLLDFTIRQAGNNPLLKRWAQEIF